jgi:hypothetical protein
VARAQARDRALKWQGPEADAVRRPPPEGVRNLRAAVRFLMCPEADAVRRPPPPLSYFLFPGSDLPENETCGASNGRRQAGRTVVGAVIGQWHGICRKEPVMVGIGECRA